ncbi:CheR family methyltransferase [Persephonella sp.]
MNLEKLKEKIYEYTGNLYDGNRIALLESKVKSFLEKHNVSIDEIFKNHELLDVFIDSILVNETSFFRHKEQMYEFRDIYLKEMIKNPFYKIMSAGCSTGKEVYSLAMMIISLKPDEKNKRITGIDLSSSVLSIAREGIYDADTLEQIPVEYREYVSVKDRKLYINKEVKEITEFKQGNIVAEEYFFFKNYTAIFCRNVIIYFTKEKFRKALENFHKSLSRDGILVLAPTEKIDRENFDLFTPEKKGVFTFYRRVN